MKKCTTNHFIQKSILIHGDKYDYSLVEYITNNQYITIICKKHGKFNQLPLNHLAGYNCKKCGILLRESNCFKTCSVSNVAKIAEIHQQKIDTCQEKYGVEYPIQNITIKEKIKQTNLKKYGVKFHTQKNIINILPLIQDYDWLFEQYIIYKKTAKQIAIELNINGQTILNYLKLHEIEIKQYFWTSYKCQLWLEQQTGTILTEYNIPGTRYRADGYCKETNTIYEFYGDYWHGNPQIYLPEEINEVNRKPMSELYEKTIEREHLIKSLGYNLVVIWENNFKEKQ